jgi:Tfp pilus assembly protein PilF
MRPFSSVCGEQDCWVQANRVAWLTEVVDGKSLAAALSISAADVDAVARLGAAALAAGRVDRAEQVFSALVALEPHQAAHRFHLAVVLHHAHRDDEARSHLDVVIVGDATGMIKAEALQLRAQIRAAKDRIGALRDLADARAGGP